MDIVERIAESGPAGARLTDLARAVGLSKAAAYATLATLRARGLVTDDGEGMTRRYRLGLSLCGSVTLPSPTRGSATSPCRCCANSPSSSA